MELPQFSYVVAASPLSKLFMQEWQQKIEANPDLVLDEKIAFTVIVPRSSGALLFTYNKPLHVTKVLPKQPARKRDEYPVDDQDGTILWLTGGDSGDRSNETDIYGVVGLHVDMDISGALADVAEIAESDGEDAKKTAKNFQEMQRQLVSKTREGMKVARDLADERVRRALRTTHINLMRQWETLKTEGKGTYNPSVAEAVGAHVLSQEIEKSMEHRKKMLARMAAVMNQTSVLN